MIKALTIFTGNGNRELCRTRSASASRSASGSRDVTTSPTARSSSRSARTSAASTASSCSRPARRRTQTLMELLIMIDALKRASAGSIVAIIPYFGYARQDRKVKPRTPITRQARRRTCITAAGADRALAMDLHAGQIQGFFDIPFDHLFAHAGADRGAAHARLRRRQRVVVSPDAGGVERARAFSKRLGASARDHRQAPRARRTSPR